MAWADETITRSDIDDVEGSTFTRYDANTTLKIADNDASVLTFVKGEVEEEIIRKADDFDFTESELLDALSAADTRGLLKKMILYKFLANWFTQDTSTEGSISWQKAALYRNQYYRSLNEGLAGLASKLSTPKNPKRYRLAR